MLLRETGRSRAVSPLDLGGEPLRDESGDDPEGSPERRGPEDGWKALWRRVNSHKSRQASERKAAKQVIREASSSPCLIVCVRQLSAPTRKRVLRPRDGVASQTER